MSDQELYAGYGVRLLRETAPLPDGRTKTMTRLHRCDSVHILAFDSAGSLLLLHEYRPFYTAKVWMLPSGKVDKEDDVRVAAQRELREETGFRAESLEPFMVFHPTESMEYAQHVFLAKNLQVDPLPQDDAEMIDVHTVSLEEATHRVLECSHPHPVSVAALLAYAKMQQV